MPGGSNWGPRDPRAIEESSRGTPGTKLQGPAGFDPTGWSILAIEGHGVSAGVVDHSISLSGLTLGSNGLLLIRSDARVILPGPDAPTAIAGINLTPDLEHDSNSVVIGFGSAPTMGTDLDTPSASTLDAGALAGFTVSDAVSIVENDGANNFSYADDPGFAEAVLGPYLGPIPGAHTPDFAYRVLDTDGKSPGLGRWRFGRYKPGRPGAAVK